VITFLMDRKESQKENQRQGRPKNFPNNILFSQVKHEEATNSKRYPRRFPYE